jgi:ubiquitin-conjugating enzyme E2 variant
MRTSRVHWGVGVVGSGLLAGGHLAWLAGSAGSSGALAALAALVGLALGALAVDAITGAVHWACDTWGGEDTPWIGESLIRSFREHHRSPLAMLRSDAIDVNGQAALAALPMLVAMAWPPAAGWLAAHPLPYGFLVALAGVGAFANQLHAWAHTTRAPGWVQALQRRGVLLSPVRHGRHHRAPHTGDYCISSGWLNRPLDAIGFWRALERGISRATGAKPRRDDSLTSSRPDQPEWRNDEAGRMARQGSHR